ncbi:MAG: TIM-barrel domain-containing protein, partial [Candidatus Sulfotelmatobacter sp.]
MNIKKKPGLPLFLLALFVVFLSRDAAHAQWAAMNPVTRVRQQTDGVLFTQASGTLKVQVCSDSMIRVLYSPTSTFPKRPDFVVLKENWPATKWIMQSSDSAVTLTTALLKIVVTRKDGSINYSDVNGGSLVQEQSRKMIPVRVNGEDTYRSESFVNIYGSHEALYGLGQHQAGVWNYRGESVDIAQDNSNISVPLMLSTKGYGIFWNNDSRSRFNNRFANYLYISSEVADVIDYYFIYGPDFDKIIAGYRELTGQVPMFGKWAYGFWQCKNRYKSQDEILGVAKKYRDLHIPVDNIVQDWFWWNRKGEFVFNKNYPDPKAMVDQLHAENFHLMISIWPFFEPGSTNYDYMEKKGWFVDKFKYPKPPYHTDAMAVYDATSPEARKFYWDEVNKGLFSIGVDAWWMDTTEPETEGQEDNILLNH